MEENKTVGTKKKKRKHRELLVFRSPVYKLKGNLVRGNAAKELTCAFAAPFNCALQPLGAPSTHKGVCL